MTFDYAPLANILGFLALGTYIVTLLPTNLRIVFPQTRQTEIPKYLLKNRRVIGILSFILAVFHGYILVMKRDFDFFDLKTSWVYIQGVSTFIVFTLLAITSNDWSVKRLKKNWKRLHNLTYLALFMLTWHVWDKMSGHWSWLTPFGLIGLVTITWLYLARRWQEYTQQKVKKQQSKVVTTKQLQAVK